MTKKADLEREEAISQLRQWLKPGDTVNTIMEHVSRSGMSREIRCVVLSCEDGTVTDLHPNYSIAKAIRHRQGKRDGIVMGGCGMDMGFALVYELSYTLFPDGFGCTGKDCPSNDHSNGDRDYTPHTSLLGAPVGVKPTRGFHWHKDGGYALKQRWL